MRKIWQRPILSWAFYDVANSAFATSVLSVVFNVYFAAAVVPKDGLHWAGFTIPGESLWSYLISAVMIVVVPLSPVVGAIADLRRAKRGFLLAFAFAGAAATAALLGARPGRVAYTSAMVFAATLAYEVSLVFYNAFLNDLSDATDVGEISGWGFALGYVGGGICLALNMVLIAKPTLFGLPAGDSGAAVRAGMLIVGAWWAIFTLPAAFWLRDRPGPTAPVSLSEVVASLRTSIRDLVRLPSVGRFLVAYLIYNDGIQTVLLMASIFGAKALGMTASQLAMCFLFVQFVAFVSAFLLGRAADRWGHKNVVSLTLAVFSGVMVWGLFIRSATEFWILATLVGLVMGGSQAASRSLFSLLIPEERAGEFYGIFSIVGKAASVMGPFVFGVAAQFWGLRAGVGSLLIFFVIGTAVLRGVREPRATVVGPSAVLG